MLFHYQAVEKNGESREGEIEAINTDVAVVSLQRRGLIVSSVRPADEKPWYARSFGTFSRVTNKDIVILSRQLSTLFEAEVSALQIFKLLAAETDKPPLRAALSEITDDLQGGSAISKALAKHPKVFSDFYVNMVKAGEESGKLNETFGYLADYLERTYEVTSKAKHALVYPAFVITVFIGVMVLLLTKVIPSLSQILKDSGQEVPLYTKAVIGISDFLTHYGLFFLLALIVGGFFLYRSTRTPSGRASLSRFRLSVPYIGDLYRKLYLSRITSNLNTMLISAIPIVKAIEVTGSVVGDATYGPILSEAAESVRVGRTVSSALSRYKEIPGILVQMTRVGEETGELGAILKTLSRFYEREVITAVDTIVSLIEPAMIILLGVGVGFILASVLIPIYNISSGIS